MALQGEEVVRRLFDFRRLPGARREVSNYFRARYGVVLEGGVCRCESLAPPLLPKSVAMPNVFGAEDA